MPAPSIWSTKFALIDEATAANNEIVAAVSGKRIVVTAYVLVADAAVDLAFKSATTAITGPLGLGAANGGVVSCVGAPDTPLFETARGAALNITASAAVQHSGHLTYIEI